MTINSQLEIKSGLGVRAQVHYLSSLMVKKKMDRTKAYLCLRLMLILEHQTGWCLPIDFDRLYEKVLECKKSN